jgi:hypothetical protein
MTVNLAIIDNSDTIDEIATFMNDVVIHTRHELRVGSRLIDPIAYVKQDGTVKKRIFSDKLPSSIRCKNIEVHESRGNYH